MNHRIFVFIGFCLVLISCQKEENEHEAKSTYSEVYELSEMALLMEDMYAELKINRSKIISNSSIGDFPPKFNKIHTAEMTPSFSRSDEFKRYSDLLLLKQKELYTTDKNQIKNYNGVVQTCIACHKSDAGCFGPIQRIEKLYIKE